LVVAVQSSRHHQQHYKHQSDISSFAGETVSIEPSAGPFPKAHPMFAALHGELTWHPWFDPATAVEDAYSLFYKRSMAMGWLRDAAEGSTGGVWGMNDAGDMSDAGPQGSRIAWFQVSLDGPWPDKWSLPLQPFLSCIGDVVARMGTVRLDALQVRCPLDCFGEGTQTSAANRRSLYGFDAGARWFGYRDAQLKTGVRVTVDSGQDQSVLSASRGILQRIERSRQNVFERPSLSDNNTDDLALEPAVADNFWQGPAQHRITLEGTLAEWSLDALGWLATFLTEAASEQGVSTPVMLTARKLD
jgi:hypothetical protein